MNDSVSSAVADVLHRHRRGECYILFPMVSEGFRSLQIDDWRQFDAIDIEFHPRVTVLTGANASGKSTILALLARHFNWSRQYAAAPIDSTRKSANARWSPLGRRRANRRVSDPATTIGRLGYRNGGSTLLQVPTTEAAAAHRYDVTFTSQQSVSGVYITSHKFVSGNYSQVLTIPALFGGIEQLHDQFTNEVRTRWLGGWTGKTPQLALKEALMTTAIFGEGNSSVERNDDAAAVWEGIQRVLRIVFPRSLGFRRLRIRASEVVLETNTGDFILDEASGGISAIFEITWQILLRSRNADSFTAIIDEPENHLHPSLQREVLARLVDAFPDVQFIVASHSPFVVTSVPESNVYALDYNADDRVESRPLDYVNKAASADETLRKVLGLDSTMPHWAEDRFRATVNKYLQSDVSSESLLRLRGELEAQGLVGEFPRAMVDVAELFIGESNRERR